MKKKNHQKKKNKKNKPEINKDFCLVFHFIHLALHFRNIYDKQNGTRAPILLLLWINHRVEANHSTSSVILSGFLAILSRFQLICPAMDDGFFRMVHQMGQLWFQSLAILKQI